MVPRAPGPTPSAGLRRGGNDNEGSHAAFQTNAGVGDRRRNCRSFDAGNRRSGSAASSRSATRSGRCRCRSAQARSSKAAVLMFQVIIAFLCRGRCIFRAGGFISPSRSTGTPPEKPTSRRSVISLPPSARCWRCSKTGFKSEGSGAGRSRLPWPNSKASRHPSGAMTGSFRSRRGELAIRHGLRSTGPGAAAVLTADQWGRRTSP